MELVGEKHATRAGEPGTYGNVNNRSPPKPSLRVPTNDISQEQGGMELVGEKHATRAGEPETYRNVKDRSKPQPSLRVSHQRHPQETQGTIEVTKTSETASTLVLCC